MTTCSAKSKYGSELFRSRSTDGFLGRANFCDVPPAILIRHMRDQVDGSPPFLCHILQRDAACAPHGELREAPQSIAGGVGVNRRERPAMSGVECVEEDARLRSANLPYNNPVGPVAQCGFQQVCESDLALVGIELGLGGDDVPLPYVEFGDVFEDEDAVAVRA